MYQVGLSLGSSLLLFLLLATGCGDAASVGGGGAGSSSDDGTGEEPGAGGAAGTGGTGTGAPGTVGDGEGGVSESPAGYALKRGDLFFGEKERFNRYVTDPTWEPSRTVYVSRTGSGSGSAMNDPASVSDGLAQVRAGERLYFLRDALPYQGCWELEEGQGGTYDAPLVLFAERNDDGASGVQINCCEEGRSTCFNLEGANYVAVDGFTLYGGKYGVRAVGLGFEAERHQVGIAIVQNVGSEQCADPFFTGQSDWIVVEGNVARGAGACDGHGIYLSNGSDWMLVRGNDLYENDSSDFQINADPEFACEGMPFDDERCDGSARSGLGQGVSEFVLVENNYFHNGNSQGPNFTSVRNSVVRNNVMGLYARHGVSFWQETDNPKLGSSDNRIHHNLFIGDNRRHVLQFQRYSDRNDVQNNVFLAVSLDSGSVRASAEPVLVEVDTATISENHFLNNFYAGGTFDGHAPGPGEHTREDVSAAWFLDFPMDRRGTVFGFRPSASAPYLDLGNWLAGAPVDLSGKERAGPTDLGPFER